jgi:hypothetical protein
MGGSPELGRSVNPKEIRGVDYAQHITANPLGFKKKLSGNYFIMSSQIGNLKSKTSYNSKSICQIK